MHMRRLYMDNSLDIEKNNIPIKLGSVHKGYNQGRNIINIPYKNVKIVKVIDIFKVFTHISYKLFSKNHLLLKNFFFDAKLNLSNVNHFFNGISLSNTPWITTFETSLPRLGGSSTFWYKLGIKRLAHHSCKKIIAMSHCAYKIQDNYLKNYYPEYYQTIVKKMVVIHPPQKPLLDNYKDKKTSNNKFVFTIVGGDFFRKGGREILNVFDRLIPDYPNVELNIVSNMSYGDYASKASKQDLDNAIELIEKYPQHINQYYKLLNSEVLNLFKRTHVGLLPTWGDTYGYSLLESQAAGCPVISTDIRALPEINNDVCGWLINVPKDEDGNGLLKEESDRKHFQQIIESQLYQIIKNDILANPIIAYKKGEAALERIKNEHCPYKNASKLEDIYQDALYL